MAFGWGSLFTQKMFAVWILDFLVAFTLGVAFQYFTLHGATALSVKDRMIRALKVDAASIVAWQVGMYGAMALAQFAWIRPAYGTVAPADTPVFWGLMQVSMICGFATAFPVNWLLVRLGVKQRM